MTRTKTVVFRCIALLLSVAIFIPCAELLLRATGAYETWMENNKGEYASPYVEFKSWYLTMAPNSKGTYGRPEFDFDRHTNSLGLRDKEWAEKKPEGVTRIIALGDSFTEGQGAELRESYPKVLERLLVEKGYDVEVLNAGKAGSDPFFQYVLLRDKLIRYSPDLVLVMINRTDVDDIVGRGGMERFHEDGMVFPPRQPRTEPLYKQSFLYRLIHHEVLRKNSLFLSQDEMQSLQEISRSQLVDAAEMTQDLGKENGFDLMVVIQPMRSDLKKARVPMPAVARLLGERGIPFFDVTPLMSERLGSAEPIKKSINKYSWDKDGHFNAAGYAILAELILTGLLEQEML